MYTKHTHDLCSFEIPDALLLLPLEGWGRRHWWEQPTKPYTSWFIKDVTAVATQKVALKNRILQQKSKLCYLAQMFTYFELDGRVTGNLRKGQNIAGLSQEQTRKQSVNQSFNSFPISPCSNMYQSFTWHRLLLPPCWLSYTDQHITESEVRVLFSSQPAPVQEGGQHPCRSCSYLSSVTCSTLCPFTSLCRSMLEVTIQPLNKKLREYGDKRSHQVE